MIELPPTDYEGPAQGAAFVEVPWWQALPTDGFGVYALFGPSAETIYVGATGHPRSRLRRHRHRDGIRTVRFWQTDTRAEAEALEAQLIAALRPRDNISMGTGRFGGER